MSNVMNKVFNQIGYYEELDINIQEISNNTIEHNRNINTFEFSKINKSDVLKEIRKLKNKCPGYDNILVKQLRMVSSIIIEPLTNELNYSFHKGKYPQALNIVKIIPVYKSGNKNKVENYRPV
jgi:hypothetical protein